MYRTITLSVTEEFENVNIDNSVNVHGAIGYLSCWAIHSLRYCNLTLYGDRRGSLNATYRDKDGIVTYTMYGQRDEDGSFSFHS